MARGSNALALLAAAALLGIVATARGATRRQPTRRQSPPTPAPDPVPAPPAPGPVPAPAPRVWPVADAPRLTVKGRYLNQRSATHRHRGIDLHGAVGDPVRAAGGGVVAHAGRPQGPGFRGYGPHYVVIDHGGVWTLYGHLDGLRVRPGDRVVAGDLIGKIADGVRPPHVHFEAARRAYPMPSEAERIDPSAWLRGE